MPERATICALDVSFFTFRAYHALPPLNTSGGLPTNAVHGVANMLEKLWRLHKPSYAAAAFDMPGPTFRNEIYPAYKANRQEPDEDLKVQFPYVRRLIEAMAIRSFGDPRYEADDILATLAKRLSSAGHEVVLVTGDKDLMQCVTEHVTLYDPIRDRRIGIPEVIEKFGVPPAAVVDVQALMGDSTDNIPGVKGVGPKTATLLIQHFQSLENLLAHTEEIEKLDVRGAASIRRKIEESTEAARLSKRLATVNAKIEMDFALGDLAIGSLHTPELLRLAEELEMERFASRIIRELSDGDADGAPDVSMGASAGPEASPSAGLAPPLGEWRDLMTGEVAFVLGAEALGTPALGLSDGRTRVVVGGNEAIRDVLHNLEDRGVWFSGHDLKGLCRDYGVQGGTAGLDVGVASYLYDPSVGEHGAKDVVERFLHEEIQDPRGSQGALVAALQQMERAIPVLRAALVERHQDKLYETLEHPLIRCLAEMEARGVRVDAELLRHLSEDFRTRMAALERPIYEEAKREFNILSPSQLQGILFDELRLPTKGIKKTKRGYSTDSDSLEELAHLHKLPALVLEYRALAKLKSTYADSLLGLIDSEGRIHTRFNQTVTATGRLSSTTPNLQNIPVRTEDGRRIRQAFRAAEGCKLVSADYNQIELRVLADLSRDPTLMSAFEQGRDIHTATASEVFEIAEKDVTPEMRRTAKVINYGIIYGMGAARMARELDITRAKAEQYIHAHSLRYPGVQRFYAEMREMAGKHGYVETRAGRRRYLPEIHSTNEGLRQAAERVATNTPIQGGAADIIKVAMVRLASALSDGMRRSAMILQIHDELLLECPVAEVEEVVLLTRECMEGAADLAVPVLVDVGVGDDWAAAH
jgi:DNA polymerase-1